MKKTTLTTALLLVLSNAQSATLDANAEYDFTIRAAGSCFAFGDCTTLVDNVSSVGDPGAGDDTNNVDAIFQITTSDDAAGGVNFTVTSAPIVYYEGTAGNLFTTTNIGGSGSVNASGDISYTPTGRLGAAELFAYLGNPAWNINNNDGIDNSIGNGGSGINFDNSSSVYAALISGSMTNVDPNDGTTPVLTLTGTALDNSLDAVIVSVSNVGFAWGAFAGTPYSEVWTVNFTKTNSAPIAQDDAVSFDQGTSSNTISVLADNGNGVDTDPAPNAVALSISAVSATTNGGTATISATDIIYDAPTLPAGVAIQSDSFTYTVTDGTFSSTATVTVTLNDITIPVITLNGTDPTNIANGSPYVEPNAVCSDNFDADKNATIGGDMVNTSIDATYNLTYNCTDLAGNIAVEVTRAVIVSTADQPPVIAVTGADPLDVTVTPGNSNSYTESIANSDVTCTDDRDTPTLTNDALTVVDTSTLGGPFTITYDCIDSVPQSANSVARDINVVDNIDPVVTPTGLDPTNVVVGITYVEQGATCTDNFDSSPVVGISPAANTVDTSFIGSTTTITYTCTDGSGNTHVATIDVVTISTGPVITINGNDPTALFIGQTYIEAGAVCTDDVDASKDAIISGDMVNTSLANTYTVRYNCSDSDGNDATEVTRAVIVGQDTELPIITLNGADTLDINNGFTYFEEGAVCSDNSDTDKDATIGGDTVDTAISDTYIVSYSCADSAGNNAIEVTRTIKVNSEISPAATSTSDPNDDEIGSIDWLILTGIIGLIAARRRKV